MRFSNYTFLSLVAASLLGCTKGKINVDAPLGLNLDIFNSRNRTVETAPTSIPSLFVSFASPEGTMEGFDSITMFLWPKYSNGRRINEFERQQIVEVVNASADKAEQNMFMIGGMTQKVCGIKIVMFPQESGCVDFWGTDKPEWDELLNPRPENPCDIPNITTWIDAPTEPALKEAFDKCQAMAGQVDGLEIRMDGLKKETLGLGLRMQSAIKERNDFGARSWKAADGPQGRLRIKFADDGRAYVQLRLKIDNVTYSNFPEDNTAAPFTMVGYDHRTGFLNLVWNEMVLENGQPVYSGATYRALKLTRVDKGPVTQFRGRVFYRPAGTNDEYDGRFVISGILRPE